MTTKKKVISVPGSIRYITEWNDFLNKIDQMPCIIDKQVTGCGFTEWCLSNNINVILCSPRKILLENKEEQHSDTVLYVRNEFEKTINYDKNITSTPTKLSDKDDDNGCEITTAAINHFKSQVKSWALSKFSINEPCKILVTYDSFRLVKEALIEENLLQTFLVVVDEFQSVFVDSKFKSSTEMELLKQLQGIQSVMYVSATPMIDSYLQRLKEFKDLPYYELDWRSENEYRVVSPEIELRKVFNNTSITSIAVNIIEEYRSGKYDRAAIQDPSGDVKLVESKEAVFYVNSVKNICDIIKKAGIKSSECNILCANTKENLKKVRAVLQFDDVTRRAFSVGKVPKRGTPHKMFTFCTRTVYLGADFYSTNAKSFVFSDANVDSLSVDITLDLPQILGRQRLECNPWKNRAILYYRVINADNVKTLKEFREYIDKKIEDTAALLRTYDKAEERDKSIVAKAYLDRTKSLNYKSDYVAVNTHNGGVLIPEMNDLVLLSEERTYEIQQIDFKDRFSVFRQVSNENTISTTDEDRWFIQQFYSIPRFIDRMKFICTSKFKSHEQASAILEQLPGEYKNYILVLGTEKILALGCQKSKLDECMNNSLVSGIGEEIYKLFVVGEKYTKVWIKDQIGDIYKRLGITTVPKANDLEKYFNLKPCLVSNKETGKRDAGFEIISKKL